MKVWTPEELATAEPAMLQRYYATSAPDDVPAELKPIRRIRDVAIDLQCELNEAREILNRGTLITRCGESERVNDWLARNSPKGCE